MNMPTDFEWDDQKDAANIAKHGIPFAEAVAVFLDINRIDIATIRAEDGEDRMKSVGMIEGRLFTVVYVMRGMICRIISARRSNGGEERRYGNHSL
ncbi:MAG TPA: BrnT family toxin [Stellaceae bacterium]|jgi:uncharacterized DUF497 family protein|nr:BrnT family toxin [Stellaceae bacterium]